jgi:F0F1-type ATP synthase assembly protein I
MEDAKATDCVKSITAPLGLIVTLIDGFGFTVS